jgi:regulator of protease activity HflC (stomatin/prohibitin superfamily)
MADALAQEPQARIAGVILITDGQVHDLAAAPALPAPLHVLLTGRKGDWDRRLSIANAPAFAIIGEEASLSFKVEDQGQAPAENGTKVDVTIGLDADAPQTFSVPIGQEMTLPLTLPHAGINVVRVNFDRADPPREVIDSFREVQAAQQERDRLEKEADAYANRVTAGARGESARLLEESEAYRAQVVNNASGEASRFISVFEEYVKAPDVTRRRMYLETMERVFGDMNKVILDGVGGEQAGQGVVPFLPLNELGRMQQGAAAASTSGTGGGN